MKGKLLARLEKETGVADLLGLLAKKISPADLQSLLLAVYAERAAGWSPADLLYQYQHDRFVKPSTTPAGTMRMFDQLAQALTDGKFEWLELSPVAPLGSCAAIATVHQDKVMATARNSEVVADSTNVLALEAAVRRRELLRKNPKSAQAIRLCASHRLVRAQPLPGPHFLSHFRLFCLCTAGRDEGNFAFEINALKEHLAFYLQLMSLDGSPFSFENRTVKVTAMEPRLAKVIENEVFENLENIYPQVAFSLWPERQQAMNYYQKVCFQINAANADGLEMNLVDGGATDWTQKLLSSKKERCFTSAIGSELACRLFLQK